MPKGMYLLTILRESQYKRKFRQWRQDGKFPPKHYKEYEMRSIIQKGKQRKQEENKNTAFRYRGWRVEPSAIDGFEKRNKINLTALAATNSSPLGMVH